MTATTAGRVRSLPFLRALGTRDFRLLWTSEAISLMDDSRQMNSVFRHSSNATTSIS